MNLIVILGDQLSFNISALDGANPQHDRIVMCELADEASYVAHHQQKLVLFFSAMRHFAKDLQSKGFQIDYQQYSPDNQAVSFQLYLQQILKTLPQAPDKIIVTEPGEHRLLQQIQNWPAELGVALEIRPDNRFICSIDQFKNWAKDKKQLRMEFFYREMRKQTGWLMEPDTNGKAKPVGDRWNYDAENRKKLPRNIQLPQRPVFEKDQITLEAIQLVKQHFSKHMGDADQFNWPVNRQQALQALDDFIEHCLVNFGDYQDAMTEQSGLLYHSLISSSVNCGLLQAREVCQAAINCYKSEKAPLAAVEGFVRQIIGWREFIRGIYWLKMPDYAESNYFNASRALPDFFWNGQTDMNCLSCSINNTIDQGYAHHIQRLMVIGNFSLLTGLAPKQVEAWYLAVYVDAIEWVELPNTHGMALFADGGVFASKPYAASGAYINRMSDYCKNCKYQVKQKTGEDACPLNYLYWNFLHQHRQVFSQNPRMALILKNLDKMSHQQLSEIRQSSEIFLKQL